MLLFKAVVRSDGRLNHIHHSLSLTVSRDFIEAHLIREYLKKRRDERRKKQRRKIKDKRDKKKERRKEKRKKKKEKKSVKREIKGTIKPQMRCTHIRCRLFISGHLSSTASTLRR